MIETKITCDGCGEEINPLTNYSEEYYLELQSVRKGPRGPVSFAMSWGEPLGTKQFCDKECVRLFVDK